MAAALLCLAGATSIAASVVDDTGQRVSVTAATPRIVTLSPHATELVEAAGAAGRLVAIASGARPPDSVADLPRIGGAGPIDRERLLSLSPDLVVGWLSGNRRTDLRWIRTIGIPLYLSEPRDLADIAASIRSLGRLAGTEDQADQAAVQFLQALDTPCMQLPPKTVYVSIWPQPAMSLGGRHWINEVLQRAGMRNTLADHPRAVMRIAPEQALLLEDLPQLSLQRTFDGSPSDRLAEQLSRPGPRLADAVATLCRQHLESVTMARQRVDEESSMRR
jgi:iron complex transport system substrate-binding protein